MVNGSDQEMTINYTSVYYPTVTVTFVESGLPTSSNWSVELYGYVEWGTGTTLTFTEANGTFPFLVSSVGYVPTPSSGSVPVVGIDVVQRIAFALPTGEYGVTFTESGLPTGDTWYVNVTGSAPLLATVSVGAGTTLVLDLPNGSYWSGASTSASGWTTPASGQFTVDGASQNVAVPFTSGSSGPPMPKFLVTFTETGLPRVLRGT